MSKVLTIALAIGLLMQLCGCSPVSTVTKQAAFDLNCPEGQIQVQEITSHNYGAVGCGQKASYLASCSPFSCVALKQSSQ